MSESEGSLSTGLKEDFGGSGTGSADGGGTKYVGPSLDPFVESESYVNKGTIWKRTIFTKGFLGREVSP